LKCYLWNDLKLGPSLELRLELDDLNCIVWDLHLLSIRFHT
jgi:hypothetical protein